MTLNTSQIDPKLIDQLLASHGRSVQDIAGDNGLLKKLSKALIERAMQAEMTEHAGYALRDYSGAGCGLAAIQTGQFPVTGLRGRRESAFASISFRRARDPLRLW